MIDETHKEVCYKKCSAFLEVADEFRLGDLTTEKSNFSTENLSFLSINDIDKAVSVLKETDIQALEEFSKYSVSINELLIAVKETLTEGNKIYLCGCGSTGRLSMALEFIWRNINKGNKLKNSVIGFMAGGDVALINSIEQFEDYPEYGARQLRELGFGERDLFIGITEGGETPFVIGATEESLKYSSRKPFFLYCNPDDVLIKSAIRSEKVIRNFQIIKVNLDVGPMAITGSTRMQASTVLMYAVGLCLMYYREKINIEEKIRTFIEYYSDFDLSFLSSFIIRETEIYKEGKFLFYETNEDYGISVLTDTTERSPTFSLNPFENQKSDNIKPSLCYLLFPGSEDSAEAWYSLLSRKPRALNWKNISEFTTDNWLYGFDFSKNLITSRERYLSGESKFLNISETDNILRIELEEIEHSVNLHGLTILEKHLCLKMILNTLSTLVMGRLGRYEGNVMTWVRPSNNKLIDRTIRYVSLFMEKKGKSFSYEEIARACFTLIPSIKADESLVLAVVDYLVTDDKEDVNGEW